MAKQRKAKKKNPHEGEAFCPQCNKYRKLDKFYKVKGNDNRNHASMLCKDCIKNYSYYTPAHEHIDIVRLQDLLRRMNLPFIASVYAKAEASQRETIGRYMSSIKLGQYNTFEWHNSIFVDDEVENADYIKNFATRSDLGDLLINDTQITIFAGYSVTYEYLNHKYGKDFGDMEKVEFERAYFKLKKGYTISTESDETSLVTASIAQVKLMKSMADDNAKRSDVTEWSKIFNQSISKLNKVDYTTKLGSYSMIMRALEENEDIVTILPEFLETPKDDIDMILYAHIYKDRELLGLDNSQMQYGDMYKFYEKLKKETLAQQERDKKTNTAYEIIGEE